MKNSALPPVKFISHPSLAGEEGQFTSITVSISSILRSYRRSLFAHEWLTPEGRVKDPQDLSALHQSQYQAVIASLEKGQALPQPVLGIGLLECVEIGAGRDVFMVLAALGYGSMPVHVPRDMAGEFASFRADHLDQRTAKQKGNALWYILIAIVLLAALSYAITRSSRFGSASMVLSGQVDTSVAELLSYADTLRDTVARLRLRGCSETGLNFAHADWADPAKYINPAAPNDGSCDVFASTGGSLLWKTPPTLAQSTGATEYLITGAQAVKQVGTDNTASAASTELLLIARVTADMCSGINRRLDISGTPAFAAGSLAIPPTSGSMVYGAAGTFGFGTSLGTGTAPNAAETNGQRAGCYRQTGDNAYLFYQVLLAR